jgi:glutathione synthase/RimK-type ligase-like ATP-grasp enzyme
LPETIKRIGLLFGIEDTFPWALIDAIAAIGDGEVIAELVEIGALRDTQHFGYALILDRISHEVPFYRTFLKAAAAQGVQIINNPFWFSADDKYFGNIVAAAVDVATPRTVLLPHKQRPPNTEARSFRNLKLVDWDAVFDYLKFPIFLKPAHGGGWKNVYKVDDPRAFFEAFDGSGDLSMMAQEAIEFDAYFRIYTIGRERVHIMPYDPRAPSDRRYVRNGPPLVPAVAERLERDALALSRALGYDLNTVELAMRDGVPYAIDFTNPAPDADANSIGAANFAWIVQNMAEVLVERVRRPRPLELTGTWPAAVAVQRGATH